MPAFLTQYQSSSHIQNVSSDYKRAQIYGRHKARMLQNRKCPILTANRKDGTPSIFATAMTQQFHDLSRLRLSLYWRRHSALVCVLYRQSVIASMTWRGRADWSLLHRRYDASLRFNFVKCKAWGQLQYIGLLIYTQIHHHSRLHHHNLIIFILLSFDSVSNDVTKQKNHTAKN